MTKAEFQSIIKSALTARGFTKTKGRSHEYFLDAPDGITRFVLRVPDMKRGFVLGAQFADFGGCDGWFTHTVMAQYDFESLLAFPMELGVTEEDTRAGVAQVLTAYEPYFAEGKAAIAERLDQWAYGGFDERVKDSIGQYFGLAPIDPYSEEYRREQGEYHRGRDGAMILTAEEYAAHKEFYDGYAEYGGRIVPDEKRGEVWIHFSSHS